MKHLAAYLLLNLGGKSSPSKADITSLLGSVGIEPDEDRISKLLSELQDKDIANLITEGTTKLASVPSGSAGGAPAAGGAAAAGPAAEEKTEEKEEGMTLAEQIFLLANENEKEKEESDEDMGFGLFD